jgi:ABC-type glycerol-3-phosphate transport system substrate-binding protein
VTDQTNWETGYGEYQEDELDFFHPGEGVSRKKFLALGGMMVGAAAGTGPLIFTSNAARLPAKKKLPYEAHTNVKGHVVFWHHWASPLRHGAIRAAEKLFNQYYPGIHVTDVPFPFGTNWTKTAAAVAAGGKGAPDLEVADRAHLWINGTHKIYQPIDSLVAADKINKNAFYKSTWEEAAPTVNKKTHVYGLPFETDCRFIVINRGQFVDAGLPSRKGPTTWQQLEPLADKLDQQGNVLGFYPAFGNVDLDGWVWTNKGDWTKNNKPTVNMPQNIATGEWYKKWIDRYGGIQGYNLVKAKIPSGFGIDIFSSGHQSIYTAQPSTQAAWLYAGVQLRPKSGNAIFPYWQAFPLPHNTGGKPINFAGGFALSMPHNPHRSKANSAATWEFAKFLTFVGQLYFESKAGAIPTVPKMNQNPLLTATQNWKVFMTALKYGHGANRLTQDTQFTSDVTGGLIGDIQNGRKTPKEAFDYYQDQEQKTIASGVNKL